MQGQLVNGQDNLDNVAEAGLLFHQLGFCLLYVLCARTYFVNEVYINCWKNVFHSFAVWTDLNIKLLSVSLLWLSSCM